MRSKLSRSGLVAAAFVFLFAVLPATAGAVLSGTNGKIVFLSGRGETNDDTANLYLRDAIGGQAQGTATPITTATGDLQHRHPTWSPDRTKIAYAYGTAPPTSNFDIYVLDLTDPNATPQNITNSNNVTDDRPAWSPDGTKIAFESENADATNQLNIKLYDVASGNTTDFTSINAGTYEHKPAWTPDSQTLYYTIGDPTVANSMDIVRQPAAGGTQMNVVAAPGVSEFQPSISPDGTEMCFTRGTGFNATSRVIYALANGGGQTELPGNTGVPGYNCTWSPDGSKIAYVQGTFSTGNLVVENSDLTIGLITLEGTETDARFDGNPDWAPDGRPECADQTVETTVNTPVTVPIDCEDTGPNYERTDLTGDVRADALPQNGSLSTEDPQPLPADITYTPNDGFRGSDSFQLISFDAVGFGTRGTVTVNVQPASNDFSFGKVKRNKRKGTAKLTVNVPGPGALELAGSGKVKAAAAQAGGQGSVKLNVKPKGKTKRKLADRGKAKLKAKVTFSPDNGDPRTKSKKVKLKRK
jgi:Tol biopolymer transport system component